ncbi:MAG: hypothetical protein HJJLKODD_00870 [Phycisphaerae bacterium]|nr:hypothetical protein [Phycisphaerae bacterium]
MSHPLYQLIRCRIKTFFREPEAIFWTYGFPLIMVFGLGIAFRNKPAEIITFDVVQSSGGQRVAEMAKNQSIIVPHLRSVEEANERLRKNKTPVVLEVLADGSYCYHFDPANPDALRAKLLIDDTLQRAAGRRDTVPTSIQQVTAPGSRYVDWLVPGLIGMNLMGSGMWGIGFNLVDMRVRNLLKRLLATPMKRSHFLASMIGTRVMFFAPELTVLLMFAWLLFGVPIRGSLFSLILMTFLGAVTFAGLGLLTACRAKRIETVSGLMNLIMLPMWLMSGIFFSAERFPDFIQPFVQALPLTQINNALRAIMLDGATLASQWLAILILVGWSVLSFTLALRWFRWN